MLPAEMTLKASQAALKMLRNEIRRTALHPEQIARLTAVLAVIAGHLECLENGTCSLPVDPGLDAAQPRVRERCGNVIHVNFSRPG